MLTARDLVFERHFRPVFAPLDLALEAGGLLLVTGANGSGKTTLLRLLAGLLRPTAGRVENRARATLYIGHRPGLKDDLTVRENLAFACALAGGQGDPDAAIARMGLAGCAARALRHLSAGQRQRCALARLLLAPVPLWLLDEPFSNLDRAGQELVDALVVEHLSGGGACVMSTHGERRPANGARQELKLSAWSGPA